MVTNGAIFSSRKEMFLKSKKIFVGRGITATVSSRFRDRPYLRAASLTLSLPQPYNDRWRKHRRLASTSLVARAVDGYTHVLDYEATILMKELLQHTANGTLPINPRKYL